MQVVASWYQGWGPEARQSFLSTLVQVASGAGEGDLEAALSSLSLEGADEMLPCQIRLFKGWWKEWGHDNRSNFISNFCKVVRAFKRLFQKKKKNGRIHPIFLQHEPGAEELLRKSGVLA